MTRKEAYMKIKELNLQTEVKLQYGDNYTRVATPDLETLIAQYDKPVNTESRQSTASMEVTVDNPYEAACLTFLGILKDMGILDDLLTKL